MDSQDGEALSDEVGSRAAIDSMVNGGSVGRNDGDGPTTTQNSTA